MKQVIACAIITLLVIVVSKYWLLIRYAVFLIGCPDHNILSQKC